MVSYPKSLFLMSQHYELKFSLEPPSPAPQSVAK